MCSINFTSLFTDKIFDWKGLLIDPIVPPLLGQDSLQVWQHENNQLLYLIQVFSIHV
ncbi:hypothetical protein DPMN_107119 [Dreissena polymorpha]|uniref:Uncharacterized protein n=1 Tax=Dreissena polymorpha TaxID=45954 RepID=A0A9D4QJF9_DREPO|nr:hypothetical protein DPMN_107119 [Dreissena polymorpha]